MARRSKREASREDNKRRQLDYEVAAGAPFPSGDQDQVELVMADESPPCSLKLAVSDAGMVCTGTGHPIAGNSIDGSAGIHT